jgi:hypothetical protein
MTAHWESRVAYLLALIAAAVLVTAAFLKAGDPVLFADQITAHRITPAAWSPFLAYLFIAGELSLGAALIAFVRPRLTFACNILLMLGFIGVTAWAWKHGNLRECGCFGRLIDRGPRQVIIEDSVVIALSVAGLILARRVRMRPWQWTAFAILLVPVIVLVGFGTSLPMDEIFVGVRPGANLADFAIAGLPDIVDRGETLLTIVGPNCPACDEGVESLKAIVAQKATQNVAVAIPGGAIEAQKWRLQYLPNFPVGYAPERVLRQYYRKLPVTFLLQDGIVRRIWWNRIPASTDVQSDR